MFVLLLLGSGRFSTDRWVLAKGVNTDEADWQKLGLLLRMSLAAPLLIGGFFGAYPQIATFATFQPLLVVLGLLLIIGVQVRAAALLTGCSMLWFMVSKFDIDKSMISNLNGFKREFAFLAASIVIALRARAKITSHFQAPIHPARLRYSVLK